MKSLPRDRSWVVAALLAVLAGAVPFLLMSCSPTRAQAATTYTYSGESIDSNGVTASETGTLTATATQTVIVTGTPDVAIVNTPAVSVVGTPVVSIDGTLSPVALDVRAFGLEPQDIQWAFMITVYFGGVCIGRFLY